jgi:hypothetical protein
MSLLAANLHSLYSRHPGLRSLTLEEAADGPLALEQAACGLPTAQLGGSYLHSRYDPREEARRLLARELPARFGSAVFFGFGLGYLPEAFLRLHPGRPLVVIEPDPGLFRQALAARDLRELLGCPDASWLVGCQAEEAVMELDQKAPGSFAVLRLRPLHQANPAFYRKLEALVQSLTDRREVNLNTLRRFGRLWVRNLLANLPLFLGSPGAAALEGLFAGMPALLLAAGPSLDPVLARLRALSERLVLVAVDTSYRLCRQAGVKPDLLVTVDPQYWNSRHLDWVELKDMLLVCEPSAHPRTFHRPDLPPLHFMSSFFPIGELLEKVTGPRGRVGAGGSVATTAWDLARLTGARPLYLAGLDLGYPGRRTHARGAFFEERAHTLSGRLGPAEHQDFLALTDAGLIPVASTTGGIALTDRRMILYKWWFENQLKQHAGSSFTLAADGVRVEGLEYRPLAELLALPVRRAEIERRLQQARAGRSPRGEPRAAGGGRRGEDELRAAARRVLEELAADLDRLEALARRGLQLALGAPEPGRGPAAPGRAPAGRPSPASPGRSAAEALEEVDRQILGLASRQVAGFLFQPLIRQVLGAEAGSYREALELSAGLYRELADSAGYQAGLIRRTLGRSGFL